MPSFLPFRRPPPPPRPTHQAPAGAELLRKVRRIEITTRRLVDRGVAGEYHSVFRGRGVEFAEVRPYQPGDEIRAIDWNVTARMGAPYVKQYVEERDLTVFLVIDVSGSLGYGSRAILKRDLAAEVSALLAFAALRNQDRVGAALVSDRLELVLHPQRRRNQVLRLVREVLHHPSSGATDLEAGLAAALATLRQRAVLFVVSDFVDTRLDRSLKAAAARHDVVLLEISDPHDQELPPTGPVILRDAETGRVGLVNGRRLAEAHRRRRAAQRQQLLTLARRLGVDHLEVSTARPYLATLVGFFDRRRRRLAR
ncbi:MAG TPA: DUF58 domain-containing protein [Thermoanaerobaculia bacterium]|nr:DUF58 domain-containing protein [Thermoanaerobaculia bacterium]